jgi:hypothetical protein
MKISSPLILIGMHRSGTSILSLLLHQLGIYMGQRQSINAESLFFQRINRKIFKEAGGRWDNIIPVIKKMSCPEFVSNQSKILKEKLFGHLHILNFFNKKQQIKLRLHMNSEKWGWKDPRNSITFPIWLRIFPKAKLIHVIRNGIDVAISLHRREIMRKHTDPDLSSNCHSFLYCFRLWEQYVQTAQQYAMELPQQQYLQVHYEELLIDPKRELGRIFYFIDKEVKTSRLIHAITKIHRDRINNSQLREQYQDEIVKINSNNLLMSFNYSL